MKELTLAKGEIMFLYTDGLLENTGPQGESLRERELRGLLGNCDDVRVLQERVLERCESLWKGHLQDDVTLLLVQWLGPTDAGLLKASGETGEGHAGKRDAATHDRRKS